MSLELISHPLCPYVHRAAALLTEKGVAFTTRYVDLQAKPDWLLAISPRGKVPVLVADGTPIFESLVILEYLDETQGTPLLPADPLARARTRMWMEITNDLFSAQYRIVMAASAADRQAAVTSAREALARFEAQLVGPWFAGDDLGLVDIAAGPALVRFEKLAPLLGIDLYAGLPKVTRWSQRIAARPAFAGTLVEDFDSRFQALVRDHAVAA